MRSLGGTTCCSTVVSARTITGASALFRYVTNLRDTGEYDFDLLQIAAVAYLKKLDELHDDRACETCGRSGFGRAIRITQCTTRHLALGLITRAEGASSHGRQYL